MDLKAERELKRRQVAAFLDSHELDGVLLSRRCNFSWYTAGARNYVGTADDVGNSTLLVTRERAVCLATNIEATRLKDEDLAGTGIEVVRYSYADPADRTRTLAEAIGRRLVAADVPVAGVNSVRLPGEFNPLRWVLTESEIARYRALCSDAVAAIEGVARRAEPGRTEDELAGQIAYELRRRGCLAPVILVAADARVERHRHPLPYGKRVEKYFMLVVGAERGGLIASCSRLAWFGKLPEEMAARHRAVCTVDAALISATRPGTTLGAIFAEAQAAYAAVGHADEWRYHHQGGSTGYLSREVKAVPGETTLALENQAFAWNPSISGTKSEDTLLCSASGPELLAAPTDWPMIRAEWKGFAIARPAILER